MALHEYEGSIRGQTRFSLFVNEPAFVLGVFNLAVISTDSFKLEFNVAFVRSAYVEVVLLVVGF